MDRGASKRWAILVGALMLTVAAIFYPTAEESEASVAPGAKTNKSAAQTAAAPRKLVSAFVTLDEEPEADPFAPRGWQPPPPAPQPKPWVKATVADMGPPRPALPPPLPPLPYKFVGSMNDNADHVVYLGKGDQALLARVGVTLDGTYKVVAINAQQIEFQHIPSGQKQTLAFPVRDN